MSASPNARRDAARAERERHYAPPELVHIGSMHERTLGPVVGADGNHFTGHIGLPFKTSVHCVHHHAQPPQAASDQSEHIGFTLPGVV